MDKQIFEDKKTTKKIPAITKQNELDYFQMKYDTALATMLKSPTKENIQTFKEANDRLFDIQDRYRIGLKLKLAFQKRLLAGITYPIMKPNNS